MKFIDLSHPITERMPIFPGDPANKIENAGDLGELRIAFERWYADHADDVNFEQDVDELWEQAIGQAEE